MNTQKWLSRRWLAAIVLMCVPAGARAQSNPAENARPAKAVAVVNGEIISASDLQLALQQAGPSPVALTEGQSKQMKMDMLRMLIDAALMRQFLTKYAPPPSAADIDKKMTEMADGLKKQGKTLADFLRDTQQTEAAMRTAAGYAIMWDNYARSHVTEADIQRYYTEFKEFFDGITVRASHIALQLPPNASEADVAAAKGKLTALRIELLQKGDFAAAAKAYSQCPSKESGGDIGYITRKWGMVDEAFARTAFSLSPGQISDVVQTEFGLHIIKVTDRKAGQPSDYSKIKEDVRQYYTEEMRLGMLAQQRKAAKLDVNLANLP